MSRHADGKTHLETECLGVTPMTMEKVLEIYEASAVVNPDDEGAYLKSAVDRLCLSHERLRAELDGAMKLLEESASDRTMDSR